jgi:hypothetical protein
MAKRIGLICGALTGHVFAVINPDEDEELDDPRWLLMQIDSERREPLLMLRVDREEYMACTHHDQVQKVANRLRALL